MLSLGAVVPPSCQEARHCRPTPLAPPEKPKNRHNSVVRVASCLDGSWFACCAPTTRFACMPVLHSCRPRKLPKKLLNSDVRAAT
ncbi:hypothetical protein QR680_018617 [Steinernema hermaphroditum]|uniref:Uncharacterized protein n=1 Tax=Steinernema hermaphroditum TaxID=289476 RepID=A0AA39HII3_9BILA|nr:hypothetical protein QR680_018617 [Steinernema hermaphroditum]